MSGFGRVRNTATAVNEHLKLVDWEWLGKSILEAIGYILAIPLGLASTLAIIAFLVWAAD